MLHLKLSGTTSRNASPLRKCQDHENISFSQKAPGAKSWLKRCPLLLLLLVWSVGKTWHYQDTSTHFGPLSPDSRQALVSKRKFLNLEQVKLKSVWPMAVHPPTDNCFSAVSSISSVFIHELLWTGCSVLDSYIRYLLVWWFLIQIFFFPHWRACWWLNDYQLFPATNYLYYVGL